MTCMTCMTFFNLRICGKKENGDWRPETGNRKEIIKKKKKQCNNWGVIAI